MNGLTGMEKFSHLEDKIYLTIEFVKKLKDEKERLERENTQLKQQLADVGSNSESTEARLAELMSEREIIQIKVEAMLDAITALDPAAVAGASGGCARTPSGATRRAAETPSRLRRLRPNNRASLRVEREAIQGRHTALCRSICARLFRYDSAISSGECSIAPRSARCT